MNLDLSSAPEIAQLAGQGAPPEPFGIGNGGAPLTAGSLAALVSRTAADPARWWPRARFDPRRPVRTRLAAAPGCQLWLVTTPPGHRTGGRPLVRAGSAALAGGSPGVRAPACEVVMVLAGELVEYMVTGDGRKARTLRPNRVRVRGYGGGHRRETANPGGCYAVSLHAWW